MRIARIALIAIAVVATACPAAKASAISDMDVLISWDRYSWKASEHPGSLRIVSNGDGSYSIRFYGSVAGQWSAMWNLSVDPDPFIHGLFAWTNLSDNPYTYITVVQLPTIPIGPSTVISGSISGSVLDMDGNGATMTAPAGGSVYSAIMDNVTVRTLLSSPFSVAAGAYSTNVFGPATFSNEVGPALNQFMAIEHQCTLTAHDSLTVSSSFVVTPEPTTLTLASLAFAAILIRRRKTR